MKQKLTVQELDRQLLEVSDPRSSKYGKHLSRADVAFLTANQKATNSVSAILKSIRGVEVQKVTTYGEYITAKASIQVWEQLFKSKFYSFYTNGYVVNRMKEYHIPNCLATLLTTTFGAIDAPTNMNQNLHSHLDATKQSYEAPSVSSSTEGNSQIHRQAATTTTNPLSTKVFNNYKVFANISFINNLYEITSNTGNNLVSQCIFSSINESYSQSDLNTFQADMGIAKALPVENIGGICRVSLQLNTTCL